MRDILKMLIGRYRPEISYIGTENGKQIYHVTLPKTATEDDIYAAREAVQNTYRTLLYHTRHDGTAHFGVWSEC